MADLVLNKIKRMFRGEDPHEILDLLNAYQGKGHERVLLAILKLSEGERERLPGLVEMAQRDYRDVLAVAENPRASRTPGSILKRLSRKKRKALFEKDRRQYKRWLKR